MKQQVSWSRGALSAAAGVLSAAVFGTSCGAVQRVARGPVEAVVTVPSSVSGEQEQYIVEASANRYCEAGVRAFRNNQWDMAMTAFKQALMDDVDDEYAHFALGLCYEVKGDLASALVQYETANQLPRKPNLNYTTSVARAKAKLGK